MIKYAKIINQETGLCEVGTGTNIEFYKSLNINPDLLNDVIHEDVYFCTFVPKYYIMNIPNWLEAAYFSLSLTFQ